MKVKIPFVHEYTHRKNHVFINLSKHYLEIRTKFNFPLQTFVVTCPYTNKERESNKWRRLVLINIRLYKNRSDTKRSSLRLDKSYVKFDIKGGRRKKELYNHKSPYYMLFNISFIFNGNKMYIVHCTPTYDMIRSSSALFSFFSYYITMTRRFISFI